MTEKNQYDRIDQELSRTYFGKHEPKKTETDRKDGSRAKKVYFYVGFTIYVAVFVSCMIIFAYFGLKKHTAASDLKESAPPPSLKRMIELMHRKPPKQEQPSSAETIPKYTPPSYRLLYDYEETRDGWEIPAWETDKTDHKAIEVTQTIEIASHGKGSLKLMVDFPGNTWTAALVEIAQYLDLEYYDMISADVCVPSACPRGLKAKFILTLGEDWRFTEMSHNFTLSPGKWTTITADMTDESFDWKRTVLTAKDKQDVRKIAVRFESNMRPIYSGPIYIDNIRVWKKQDNVVNPESSS